MRSALPKHTVLDSGAATTRVQKQKTLYDFIVLGAKFDEHLMFAICFSSKSMKT